MNSARNGSIGDPKACDAACLLLHGFTGTPFEMEPLRDALTPIFAEVRAPLLPGHGASLEEMDRTSFNDWYAAAEAEYLELAKHGPVFVAGLSMGGSLGLALAERHQLLGLATLAAPVFLYRLFPPAMKDWRLPLVPLLARFRSIWPISPPNPASREIAPWRGYEGGVPLNALTSFMKGLKEVRAGLGRITCPLLVVQARGDATVPEDNAGEIYERAGSRDKKLVMLDIEERVTGHHVITTHRETGAVVSREVAALAREVAGLNR